MKVVHINTSDKSGGAAIAAYRLHKALLKKGLDSKMLVLNKITDEKEIFTIFKNKLDKFLISKLRLQLDLSVFKKYKQRSNQIIFSQGKYGYSIVDNPLVKEADIIHLHWINGGMLSIKEIFELNKMNKKIVWTLHDMWPFTGGCHYAGECKKYKKNCGNCEILKTKVENDITRKIFNNKNKNFKDINFKVIGCSNWIAECAKESNLFESKEVKGIPNVLDIKIFKKVEKKIARKILNLLEDKKYIIFGAMSSTGDKRKGYDYLKKALLILNKKYPELKNEIEILIFGASYSNDQEDIPFKINFLGQFTDEITLSLVYNSANVFVAPSLEENLANTVNESLACGTPVVAFEVGGMPDMIKHKSNGYLAKYKDSNDLANGILECLNYTQEIKSNFNQEEIIKKIIDYYKD